MSTLRDVAQRAGVSVTTASHTLNKTRFVRPATAERVLSAARELSYCPNSVARGLRTGSSRTIGVIAPSALDPFFAEVIRGVEETCYKRGYEVYLGFVEYPRGSWEDVGLDMEDQEKDFIQAILAGDARAPYPASHDECDIFKKELSLVEKLVAREVDGLILNPGHSDAELAKALFSVEAEIILFHRKIEGVSADLFVSDDFAGTSAAIRRLIELGHRRIAMVYGFSWQGHSARERFRAYREVLIEHGIALDPKFLLPGFYSMERTATVTAELLSLAQPPTAILYWSDLMAIAGMDAARARGLSVPGELSVVGFDDLEVSSYVAPRLSSIEQSKFETGTAMATRLVDRIEGVLDEPPSVIVSPASYVERDSVGRCRVA